MLKNVSQRKAFKNVRFLPLKNFFGYNVLLPLNEAHLAYEISNYSCHSFSTKLHVDVG